MVEKHKTQEGNQEGHEDRNKIFQNFLVSTAKTSLSDI